MKAAGSQSDMTTSQPGNNLQVSQQTHTHKHTIILMCLNRSTGRQSPSSPSPDIKCCVQKVIGLVVIGCGLLVCIANAGFQTKKKKKAQIKPLVPSAVSRAAAVSVCASTAERTLVL